jgi:hypothetical protein
MSRPWPSRPVWRYVALAILATVAVWCGAGLFEEEGKNDPARLRLAEATNVQGEHWVTFHVDAPKGRRMLIFGVQILHSNGVVTPDYSGKGGEVRSTGPLLESIRAGSSKQYSVRECVDGPWQFRVTTRRHLGFFKQQNSRTRAFLRSSSLTVWRRNYLERDPVTLDSPLIASTGAHARKQRENSERTNAPDPARALLLLVPER